MGYVQNSVTSGPALGAPGLKVHTGGFEKIEYHVATEDIPFGSYVSITTAGCELADSSGEVTGNGRGVALRSDVKASETGWKSGDVVEVLTVGEVWVKVEEAVTAYVAPYVRTAGTGTKGAFRASADSGNATQVNNARFKSTTGAAGVAKLELTNAVPGPTGATGATGPTG